MLSSLLQALGVDQSFFIQFLIFLLIYPVLSFGLFRPYYVLCRKREEETQDRMKSAEKLGQKKADLQKEYEKRAYILQKNFRGLYDRESRKLEKSFLEFKEQKQIEIQQETEHKAKKLLQEIKVEEQKLSPKLSGLAQEMARRLLS